MYGIQYILFIATIGTITVRVHGNEGVSFNLDPSASTKVPGKLSPRCKILYDMCIGNNDCKNGGNCTITVPEDKCCTVDCACPSEYVGDWCEIRSPLLCRGSEMVNDDNEPVKCYYGRCNNSDSMGKCICETGWKGEKCDIKIPTPQVTGSTVAPPYSECKSPINSFIKSSVKCYRGKCATRGPVARCICDGGWGGRECNQECTLACRNNGSCIIHRDKQACMCHIDYTGDLCEYPKKGQCIPDTHCVHGDCVNVSGANFQKCVCCPGWSGVYCHKKCTLQCMNGGTCHYDYPKSDFVCKCPADTYGVLCGTTTTTMSTTTTCGAEIGASWVTLTTILFAVTWSVFESI